MIRKFPQFLYTFFFWFPVGVTDAQGPANYYVVEWNWLTRRYRTREKEYSQFK